MQHLVHPLGGICFPAFPWPTRQWPAPASFRRAGRRLAGAVRRHAATTRKLTLYTATGLGTGLACLTAGLTPVEAISLGLNAAGTAAAAWPLSPAARPGTTPGGTDAPN